MKMVDYICKHTQSIIRKSVQSNWTQGTVYGQQRHPPTKGFELEPGAGGAGCPYLFDELRSWYKRKYSAHLWSLCMCCACVRFQHQHQHTCYGQHSPSKAALQWWNYSCKCKDCMGVCHSTPTSHLLMLNFSSFNCFVFKKADKWSIQSLNA